MRSGELVPVLAQWAAPPTAAWAVFPGRRLMHARTRAFIDMLAEKFSGAECAALETQVRQTKAALRSNS